MTSPTLADAVDRGLEWLNEHEARAVLREYDIPCSDEVFLPYEADWTGGDYADALAAASDAPAFPAYCKVAARAITSTSDAGGVVRVETPEAVGPAVDGMLAAVADYDPEAAVQGLVVTEDVSPGRRELLLGGAVDPQFGPVVSLGVGGVAVEVYRDVAFRLAPVEPADARELLGELRGRAMLGAWRGMDPVDEDALVEAVCALSRLLDDHPEVVEVDVNPLMAGADGVVAADALVRLG